MLIRRCTHILAAAVLGLALAGSATSADAAKRKVVQGAAVGAVVGGVAGAIVGGPRGAVAGAAVGGVAGAAIGASQPDCRWRTNRYGRSYRVCR